MTSPPQTATERRPRRTSASPTVRHRSRGARSQGVLQRRRSASPRVRAHRQVTKELAGQDLQLRGTELVNGLIFMALEDTDDRIFDVDSCHIGSECSDMDDDASCSESCCSEASSDDEAVSLSTPVCYAEAFVSRLACPSMSTPLCFFAAETGEVVSAEHLVNADADAATLPLALVDGATCCEVDDSPLPVAATVVARISVADQMLQMMRFLEQSASQKASDAALFDEEAASTDLDNPNEAPSAQDWDSEDEVVIEDNEDDLETVFERDAVETVNFATCLARHAVDCGLWETLTDGGEDKGDSPSTDDAKDISGESAMMRARTGLVEALNDGRLEAVVKEVAQEEALQCGVTQLSELVLRTRARAAQLQEASRSNTACTGLSLANVFPAAENKDDEPAPEMPSTPGFLEAFAANTLGHVFAELAVVLDARSARWFMQEIFSSISELGVGIEAPLVEVTVETVETQIELTPCEAVLDLSEDPLEELPVSTPLRQAPDMLDLTEDGELEAVEVAPSPSAAATLATAGRTPHTSQRTVPSGQIKNLSTARRDERVQKLHVSLPAGSPASSLRKHRHAMRDAGREALVSFAMDASDVLGAVSSEEAPRESSITRGYRALGVEFHSIDSGEEAESSASTSRLSSRAHSSHGAKPSRSSRNSPHLSKSDHSRPSSKSERKASARGGNAGTRALSAMELDMGMAPSATITPPQNRSASVGLLRVSKSRNGPGFLPDISSKSAGTLPVLASSQHVTSEPFAWSAGSTRARRGLGSVF